MREQLIRYLLGELDDEERREVRTLLRDNPDLQKELQHLRECFASNQEEEVEPVAPRGLAKRTSSFISNSDEYEIEQASRTAGMSSAGDAPAGVLGWSLADLTVAGGVMLAVSMLVFPALRDSREGTRQTTCLDHLHQLALFQARYAENNGGRYVRIGRNENAGVVIARLVEAGLVSPEEMTVLLKCPASQVVTDIKAGKREDILVPTGEEIRNLPIDRLLPITAKISPCYGIRLPHKVSGEYKDLRTDTPRFSKFDPVFGEISGESTNSVVAHHRGCLIQFADRSGAVLSIRIDGPLVILGDLDPFHNDDGKVAAGIGPRDIVLGPSDAIPAFESNKAE